MERPSKHELTSWAFVLSNQFPFEEARKHPASRAGTTCEHSRDCSRPTGGFLCLRNSGFLRESRTVTRRRLLRRGDGRRSLCLPPFPFKRTGGGNCRAGPQAAASILYCRGIDQKLKKKKRRKKSHMHVLQRNSEHDELASAAATSKARTHERQCRRRELCTISRDGTGRSKRRGGGGGEPGSVALFAAATGEEEAEQGEWGASVDISTNYG